MGFNKIVWVDNASPIEDLIKLPAMVYDADQGNATTICGGHLPNYTPDLLDIYRYDEHLTRGNLWTYPYCWRGLKFLQEYVKAHPELDKVIVLDTDFYILSQHMCNYLKNPDSGWNTFWCDKWSFNEAAFYVINKDSFHLLLDFPIPSYTHYNDRCMEHILPFTKVWRREHFKGDRYGEANNPQAPYMDYYGQHMPGGVTLTFNPRDKVVYTG
jgi:hypothetical protein